MPPILALLLTITLLSAAEAHATRYHFVNATLITMTNTAPAEGELLVEDGTIAAVGADLEVPADAVVIDVESGYLMPGLAEMHAHVPSPQQGERYRDEVLFLYVANGITTARGMLGAPAHLTLRDALEANEFLGPRLITSGPSFNGNSVSSPEQAAAMVREQVSAGYDFLKVHPGLTLAEYDAMASTARELGIPFAGHVPADAGLLHALDAGQATVDHLDGYVQALVPDLASASGGLFALDLLPRTEEARIQLVVDATREAGTWVVPTETLLENFAAAAGGLEAVDARPQNRYLPPELRERYRDALRGGSASAAAAIRYLELRKRLLRALQDGGVGVLLGSDAPQIFNVPGFSAHRELEAMVAAGLTPMETLRSGTALPARFFDREGDFGQLATGQAADLLWLRDNPLEDISNTRSIEGVMVRGRWLDRAAIDEGLEQIAARHAN